jgi:septal ring-binding cell division protein DamX
MAGVEFVNLSGEARTLLTSWISSLANPSVTARTDSPAENTAVAKSSPASSEPADAPQQLNGEKLSAKPPAPGSPQIRGFRQEKTTPMAVTYLRDRFRLPTILFVALALLAVGLLGLARYLRKERGKKTEKTTTVGQLALPTGGSSSALSSIPPQKLPSVSAPSQMVPGFVLQAGAMRHAENAEALERSLQQKRYPAFIVKNEADHLYEIVVGPYPDAQAAAKTRKELRDQGFETIVKHWPSH